jgi:hypothetical protein
VDEAICASQRSTELRQAQLPRSRRSQCFSIAYFVNSDRKQAHNFCAYLTKHRHRLVNYRDFQEQHLSSIGSGAVESAVKQIDRRLKISGAQWKLENVSVILQLRCAYLNGLLAV